MVLTKDAIREATIIMVKISPINIYATEFVKPSMI